MVWSETGGPLERRGKSVKRSEKRETITIKMRGPKKAIVQRAEEGRSEKREERRDHQKASQRSSNEAF